MNYELAKELKDAGFPKHSLCNNACMTTGDIGVDMCIPTLEELIEACGAEFSSLSMRKSGGKQIDWRADTWLSGEKRQLVEYGSTPTEAVTRLWLALHTNPIL